MGAKTNRRRFLQTTALTGAGFWVAGGLKAAESKAANEKIQFACIGVEGKGSSDSRDAGRHGDVVAICDVDEKRLEKAHARFPNAQKFFDYREMLEKLGDKIDAVTVSTPDHSHAPASAMAMRMGKHCFCQKPLTHSVYEARRLGEIARENNVVTQMGNQGTATPGIRRGAAVVQSGVLGKITEVHVWTNRPVWPQGGPRPEPKPVPKNLKWDLWLGPAAYRPYGEGYHPFAWRGWWAFGTGALGDMACHTANLPYMALDLKDPVSIEAEHSGHNGESYPKWSIIKFEFPATDKRGPVTMTWYDGGKLPDRSLVGGRELSKSGSLIVGEAGVLFSPNDYGASWELIGDIKEPKVEFTKSPGHFTEWVEGIKGGETPRSNFPGYASGLTETILLGNLAIWANKKVEWDAKNMQATNAPEVASLIRPEYRDGWTL